MSQQTRSAYKQDTGLPPGPSAAPLTIRLACPQDATGISSLYRAAYAGQNFEDAREHYPFPQFMDCSCLRQIIATGRTAWLVAESGQEIIGTIGATGNIGTVDDRVVEYFGLVVSEKWRSNGVATNLFVTLHDRLTSNSRFMIAETRTADAGGWRTTRNCGFVPLGFEPFAHRTPVGSEPMLLLGYIPKRALDQRDGRGHSSLAVHTLARAVLKDLHLKPLSVAVRSTYPLLPQPLNELRSYLAALSPRWRVSRKYYDAIDGEFRIVNNERVGIRLQRQWHSLDAHGSGVICLNRLEGEDRSGDRYAKRYFIAYAGESPIACARVVLDRRDRRARILYLQTPFHGLQGIMVAQILGHLKTNSAETPLSVVVDVRADYPTLHTTLETLGFFPTAYYPCLVAGKSGRLDAVQYTWLHNCDFEDSLKWVRQLGWAEANGVVGIIKSLTPKLG